jgi:hypothetical protein
MTRAVPFSTLALAALLTACVAPENVRAAPEDTWSWEVNQNYERFAHCLTDAPVHSWLYQAPRSITSFEQPWQFDKIVLKSIDPLGVEQVCIQIAAVANRGARVVAAAKNLEALGGGALMYYVRAYVDYCARA